MPKQAKLRLREQEYAGRARELAGTRKKRTRGNTPWKAFFQAGVGATIETELEKASIRAIVNTYGVRLGKRFSCAYRDKGHTTLVTIEAVKRRKNDET